MHESILQKALKITGFIYTWYFRAREYQKQTLNKATSSFNSQPWFLLFQYYSSLNFIILCLSRIVTISVVHW